VRRWPVVPVLIGSSFFFLGVASFLAMRQIAGAMVEPLPVGPLLATAVLTLAWAGGVRTIGLNFKTGKPARWLVEWAPLGAMLLVAVACSYPGDRWLDWAVWLPALATAWYVPRMSQAILNPKAESPRDPVAPIPRPRGGPATVADESPGQLLQQLTRIRTPEGRDAIHGMLIAEFTVGQQLATLHVGFCPPLEHLPHVEAEVADGPAARIKVVQVLHNGAQLDVGLEDPALEATLVSVEFMAAERGDE